MANSRQSAKRARQAELRRRNNQHIRTYFRTMVKRARTVAAGGDAAAARQTFIEMQAISDRAARKGVVPQKTVARLKRRINQAVRQATQTVTDSPATDAPAVEKSEKDGE